TQGEMGRRLLEEARAQWNAPNHLKLALEFYCANIGNREATPEEVKALMKKRQTVDEQKFREQTIVEILHRVQGDFPDLQLRDALLRFGDLFAHAERWDYAKHEFQTLLIIQSDDPVALEWTGAAVFQESNGDPTRMKEALGYFQKLARIRVELPEAHYWCG